SITLPLSASRFDSARSAIRRERGCFLVVQTLWAEKIQSTTDAGSLNTFGRNEIEVAPISSALLRIACLVILYKTCRTKNSQPMREPSTLSHLRFQPAHTTSTIHVSSVFIWGIRMKTNGQARGPRCVEGTGITDLRPLVDSLDTYARQIHSIAEIIRSIKEESAEQSTEAKAAENTAPCSLHDGQ